MEDKKVNGIWAYKPHENAPDFVKANFSIDSDKLQDWLRNYPDNQIRLNLKESRDGKFYLEVDTYKKP